MGGSTQLLVLASPVVGVDVMAYNGSLDSLFGVLESNSNMAMVKEQRDKGRDSLVMENTKALHYGARG